MPAHPVLPASYPSISIAAIYAYDSISSNTELAKREVGKKIPQKGESWSLHHTRRLSAFSPQSLALSMHLLFHLAHSLTDSQPCREQGAWSQIHQGKRIPRSGCIYSSGHHLVFSPTLLLQGRDEKDTYVHHGNSNGACIFSGYYKVCCQLLCLMSRVDNEVPGGVKSLQCSLNLLRLLSKLLWAHPV